MAVFAQPTESITAFEKRRRDFLKVFDDAWAEAQKDSITLRTRLGITDRPRLEDLAQYAGYQSNAELRKARAFRTSKTMPSTHVIRLIRGLGLEGPSAISFFRLAVGPVQLYMRGTNEDATIVQAVGIRQESNNRATSASRESAADADSRPTRPPARSAVMSMAASIAIIGGAELFATRSDSLAPTRAEFESDGVYQNTITAAVIEALNTRGWALVRFRKDDEAHG